MKVGIVGDATRGVAWEQHLRPHSIVRQVELSPSLSEIQDVDACFIINDEPDNLQILLEAVRRGLNTFLISRHPSDQELLEKIHRASKEAGTHIQFSHWPTLAPATQWMMDKIQHPNYIQIEREVSRNQIVDLKSEFYNLWVDELGLCLKWMNSGVHHIEAKEVNLGNDHPVAIHLFLRFDSGASASINIYTAASQNSHKRLVANKNEILECQVSDQLVKIGRLNDSNHIYFEKQKFDPSTSAEKAALLFLKAIQLNKESSYSSYDALRTASHINKVEQRLKQFT